MIRLLLSVPKAGPDRYQLCPEGVVKGFPEVAVAISAVTPSDPAHGAWRPATRSSHARRNQYNRRRTREDSQPMGNSGQSLSFHHVKVFTWHLVESHFELQAKDVENLVQDCEFKGGWGRFGHSAEFLQGGR